MNVRNGLDLITEDTYGFIYITTNTVNGKRYIGQKKYDNRGRWRYYLGSGYLLKIAIKKYGRNAFYKDIVDVAKTPAELTKKEKEWIQKYNATQNDDFYNISKGGDSFDIFQDDPNERQIEMRKRHKDSMRKYQNRVKGHHPCARLKMHQVEEIIHRMLAGEHDDDIAKDYNVNPVTINAIRIHKSWKYLTDGIEFPNKAVLAEMEMKPIVQYDFDGNLVNKYKNIKEVQTVLNLKQTSKIYVCLNDKTKQCMDSIWAYEDDDSINEILNDKEFLNQLKKNKANSRAKAVLQFDMNGIYIDRYSSIAEAATRTNISNAAISRVCNHKGGPVAVGYIWKFENECGDLKYGTA